MAISLPNLKIQRKSQMKSNHGRFEKDVNRKFVSPLKERRERNAIELNIFIRSRIDKWTQTQLLQKIA